MTFREKLQIDHPEYVSGEWANGCRGCPKDYGYEEYEEELKKLPVCSCCHEPIQQPDAFCVNGEYWCDDCMDDMRVEILIDRWE